MSVYLEFLTLIGGIITLGYTNTEQYVRGHASVQRQKIRAQESPNGLRWSTSTEGVTKLREEFPLIRRSISKESIAI